MAKLYYDVEHIDISWMDDDDKSLFNESWWEDDDESCPEYEYYLEELQNRTPEENWRVAYHEAGHVVAHYNLRMGIIYASIVPDKDCSGFTLSRGRLVKNYLVDAVIYLAGFLTEYKKCGDCNLEGPDLINFNDIVSKLTSNIAMESLLRQHLADIAINVVLESPGSWEAVEAVAQALFINKRMDSESLRNVIKNAKRKANRKKNNG